MRYARLAAISLSVSILAAAPAAAQRVEEARVAFAALVRELVRKSDR